MPEKSFLPEADQRIESDNQQPAQEITKVETHEERDFVIGFTGWFLVSNVILVISFMATIVSGYTLFLGLIGIWLSTIISIVRLARKRIWCSAGILAAVIVNIGIGLLMMFLVHGSITNRKYFFVLVTPLPLNYIALMLSMMGPPY